MRLNRNPKSLADQEYDVIVIGGGVTGICIAWDAALRGLSVALLERDDFAGATSANLFKMIHGGIRYLQHGDVNRLRKSCHERRFFLRAAPHLAYPLPILVPTYNRGLKRKALLRAAFWLYDSLTLDRNQGIQDPNRKIPGGQILSREECLDIFPGLECDELTGAGVFCDGQMYNPPRLALSLLKSAVDAGAQTANYMEVTGFLEDNGCVSGVVARDRLSGQEMKINGRMVVNAAGPWADQLLRDHLGTRLEPAPTFSRDACFVVDRQLVDEHALAIQGTTEDPDAVLSRGKRHLFIVPWRQYTLVGVWHGVHEGHPDKFTVEEEELQHFVDQVNEAYPSFGITLDEISMWNAGLVLFGENDEGDENLSYGKRPRIVDHASEDGLEGLVTVVGVRWTSARSTAERAVNLISRKMRKSVPKCQTEGARVYGGDISNFERFVESLAARAPAHLGGDVVRALAHNYGTEAPKILRYIERESVLGQRLGSSLVLKAEVVHAVREEMAKTLKDVALRRTDLATGGNPGAEAIQKCAELMAAELGWDSKRLERETKQLISVFPGLEASRSTVDV